MLSIHIRCQCERIAVYTNFSKFYSNITGKVTQVLCVTVNAFLFSNFD